MHTAFLFLLLAFKRNPTKNAYEKNYTFFVN